MSNGATQVCGHLEVNLKELKILPAVEIGQIGSDGVGHPFASRISGPAEHPGGNEA